MAFSFDTDSIASAVTLTAGAADVVLPTDSYIDMAYSRGAYLDIAITNGATGPTLPADIGIQIADDPDADTWTTVGQLLVAATGNDVVTRFKVFVPNEFQNVRLLCGGNTAQDVSITASVTMVKPGA